VTRGPAQLREADVIVLGLDLVVVVLVHLQAEISVGGRRHVEVVVIENRFHERDLPLAIVVVERARGHVVLEVEDEALLSQVRHILRHQPHTGFDEQNPRLAVLIGFEPVLVTGDHGILIVEEERFCMVVLMLPHLLQVCLIFSVVVWVIVH
jgi:hypothetical protein